jgi:cysteine desulfuration protein SufE
MSIEEDAQELVDSFDLFEDWEDRYSFLIDMGRSLPPMNDAQKTDDSKVHGCQSNVWMVGEREPSGALDFVADSDSSIVRGLIAVLLQVFSHRTPREILAFDVDGFFAQLGFQDHLSMGRRNGLDGMVKKIRALAAQN